MPPEELARIVGRRKALQVIGMALVAVACGPAETESEDTSDVGSDDIPRDGDSGAVTGDDGSPPDSPSNGGLSSEAPEVDPAPDPTDDPSSPPPEFDEATALETISPRDRLMPSELVEQLAAVYGGVWLGAWADSEGAEGSIDANVSFDPGAATLDIAVAATGPILGSDGLEPTSVSVPLGGDFFEFEERAPLGYMYVFNQGDEQEVISLHDPPGAPDIGTLMIRLSYGPDGAARATYEVLRNDGTTVTGVIELGLGSTRPAAPQV